MNEPRDLRALIDQALAKRGLKSGRALAELAHRHGHEVSHATVNLIRAGTYKSRPSEETVRAIAWLAGVSSEVAFRAAGLRVPGPPLADELPPGVDNLSPEARKAVLGVLRVLVQQEEVIGDAAQRDAAPMTQLNAIVEAIAAGVADAGGDPMIASRAFRELVTDLADLPDPQHARDVAGALVSITRGAPTTAGDAPDLQHAERVADALTSDRYDLAARRGEPGNPPDTTTGEESQDRED